MTELKADIPSEYSDPDRWRQVIVISDGGLRSWMFDRNDAAAIPRRGADVAFSTDSGELLRRIEDAVYDNPLLLEDFPTEIIVYTDRFVLIPGNVAEGDTESAGEIFRNVYCNDSEPMIDRVESAVIAYCLADGLGPFINRTFSGAKVFHHISPLLRHFANTPAGGKRMYADLRDGYVDIFGFSGTRLLMAATCRWDDPMDAAYYIFAARSAWNFDPASDPLCVSGSKSARTILMPLLREHINYVTLTLLPRLAARDELPLSVLLLPTLKKLPKKI